MINDVLTEPGVQADRNVQASEEDPRYEVSSPGCFLFTLALAFPD